MKELDSLHEALCHYEPLTLPTEPDVDSSQSMGTFNVSSSIDPASVITSSSNGISKRLFGGASGSNTDTPSKADEFTNQKCVALHGVEVDTDSLIISHCTLTIVEVDC